MDTPRKVGDAIAELNSNSGVQLGNRKLNLGPKILMAIDVIRFLWIIVFVSNRRIFFGGSIMNRFFATFTLIVSLLAFAPAMAATVYSQTNTNHTGGWSPIAPSIFIADDFELQTGQTTINGASWFGSSFDTQPASSEYIIRIYDGLKTQAQGGALYEFNVTPTLTPQPLATNSLSSVLTEIVFPSLTLVANQTYWFAFSPTAGGNLTWQGNNTGGNSQIYNIANDSWGNFGAAVKPSFTLFGPAPSQVPLPAASLLLLSGLAGVAGLKRRKKRTA